MKDLNKLSKEEISEELKEFLRLARIFKRQYKIIKKIEYGETEQIIINKAIKSISKQKC